MSRRFFCSSTLVTVLILILSACSSPAGTAPGLPGEPPEDGGPEPGADACRVEIAAPVTVPTVLGNHGDGCDYLVRGQVGVSAPLTIEAGTEVQFAVDSMLSIEDGGSIHSLGLPDKRVVLRGRLNVTGSWHGICFGENRHSELRNTDILNAGKVLTPGSRVCRAAIGAWSTAGEPVDMTGLFVAGSLTSGLDATRLQLGEFGSNVFAANVEYGVQAAADQVRHLDAGSDYLGVSAGAPNGRPFIRVEGVIEGAGARHSWSALNAPYFTGEDGVYGSRAVMVLGGAELSIAAGTVLVFGPDAGFDVWDGSTLETAGTAERPVEFTAAGQVPGIWAGIWAHDSSVHLKHTLISWGGGGRVTGNANLSITAVYDRPGSTLQNVHFHGSATCGLLVDEVLGNHVGVAGLTFSDNATDICM